MPLRRRRYYDYSNSDYNPRAVQFVATGGVVQGDISIATVAASTCRHDRTRHYIGAGGFTEMSVILCNYYISAALAEVNLDAITDVQVGITMNGVTKQLTFSGSVSSSMTAGQGSLITDRIKPADFNLTPATSANVGFYVVVRMVVALGDKTRVGVSTAPNVQPVGEPAGSINAFWSNNSVNQVTTGVALNTSGWTATICCPPLAFIGKTYSANKALLVGLDSGTAGKDDVGNSGANDGSNGGGYIARACFQQKVPYCNLSRSGGTVLNYTVPATAKRALMYPYAQYVLFVGGGNDMSISVGVTPANTLLSLQALWTRLKAIPNVIRLEQILIFIATTSTDAWTTVANQTPITGYETGGAKRDFVNNGIIANVGSNGLDGYLNLDPAHQDPTSLDKWICDGATVRLSTTDGAHPTAFSAAKEATILATRLATWAAV